MRPRERRHNQGVFISGATGSGKSRMAERIAQAWPRVIAIDPTYSFSYSDRIEKAESVKVLAKLWNEPRYRVAVTLSDDAAYLRLLSAIFEIAAIRDSDFCLVIDEIDLWSSPAKIAPSLSRILRYGRHYGINWVAVCRADVQTNRDVRMNATEVILFRQGMLSAEMRRLLESSFRLRAEPVPDVARLVKWDTPGPPEEGRHYVAVPDPWADWWPTWAALARRGQGH
jgi:hypothetical protein